MLLTLTGGGAAYLAYRACTETGKFLSNLAKKNK